MVVLLDASRPERQPNVSMRPMVMVLVGPQAVRVHRAEAYEASLEDRVAPDAVA
jgi:hypothetical protein